MIKHIWFDFSGTLANENKEKHDNLRYLTFSKVTGKPLDENLEEEYIKLWEKYGSNSGVFRSLGLPAEFWGDEINKAGIKEIYELKDPVLPKFLQNLKEILPISIFTNIKAKQVLPHFNIDPNWFTHIIEAGMIQEPKPSPEGFEKMIELSGVPAENILYIGDIVAKDILPAKKLGMQTALAWDENPEADYSLKNFDELLEIIG